MEFRIAIENFKSIVSAELELKKGLNILIGPNGAGKTCVLSSLKFLKDSMIKGVGLAMAKGGGATRLYHRGSKHMKFSIEFKYGNRTYRKKPRPCTCIWEIEIEHKNSEKLSIITSERVGIQTVIEGQKVILFSFEANRRNVEKPKTYVSINPEIGRDFFKLHLKNNYQLSKERLIATFIEQFAKFHNSSSFKKSGDKSVITYFIDADQIFTKLFTYFSSINEYNIIPERARQATEQLPFAKMSSNGSGISEVIDALENENYGKIQMSGYDYDIEMPFWPHRYYHPAYYYFRHSRRKVDSLSLALDNINRELSAAVRPIEKVSVDIDPTNGKRYVVFKARNQKFYPDEVSDGTIKWLCILTSIYVGSSNIYLLEEPENFLHPWMQQKLVELMRVQSEKNDTIFILTTHSTTLLNSALPDEVITVQQQRKGSEVKRIENRQEVEEFLENSDFRLGDLWISGGLGAIPN